MSDVSPDNVVQEGLVNVLTSIPVEGEGRGAVVQEDRRTFHTVVKLVVV